MKFHCERCKTRYSIADERVRGKILKIRCKNCSAVITVKENGPVSGPRPARLATSDGDRAARPSARRRAATNSGSALQGAFEQALRRPQSMAPADLGGAPAVLDAEWYVSQDGEQFGPYALPRAQDWVAQRAAGEELYCWSEGFDDWLPVEKVSHFRGLRGPVADSGLLVPGRHQSGLGNAPPQPVHPEETPIPLFAATLAQVGTDAPVDDGKQAPMFSRRNGSSVSQLNNLPGSRPPIPATSNPPTGGNSSLFGPLPPVPSGPPSEDPNDASHELEIGEASRVVKLPMLVRQSSGPARGPAPLPGMAAPPSNTDAAGLFGRGTGSHGQSELHPALAGLPIVHGTTASHPRLEAPEPRRRSGLMMPLAIGAAIVAGVVTVLLYVALTGDDEDALLRRGKVGDKGLAYNFGEKAGKKVEEDDKPSDAAESRAPRRPRKSASRSTVSPAAPQQPVGPSSDEVDLSGDSARTGELDPGDLFDVYNANKIGVTMCYNSALKRDPLLSIKRADVMITVSPTGSVSDVSIPALTGTPLGICLEKRIRSWKFPKATQVFNSRFPIIFQT